jgi:hypothetical protein
MIKSQESNPGDNNQVNDYSFDGLLNGNGLSGNISLTAGQELLNRSVICTPPNEPMIRGIEHPDCFGRDDQDLPGCEDCKSGMACYRARWGA